jgi:ankyrin repeat protein
VHNSPGILHARNFDGLTAFETVLKKGDNDLIRLFLNLNCPLDTKSVFFASLEEPVKQEILQNSVGRKKADAAVRRKQHPKQHQVEPELMWTGAGFKTKDGSCKDFIRINKHRNYRSNGNTSLINTLCPRGA